MELWAENIILPYNIQEDEFTYQVSLNPAKCVFYSSYSRRLFTELIRDKIMWVEYKPAIMDEDRLIFISTYPERKYTVLVFSRTKESCEKALKVALDNNN